MYQVFGTIRSRTLRVLWMLEELGQPYEFVQTQPRASDLMPKNPGGKVPVLVEGDHTIIDSVAIITYLADKHGQLTHHAGTPERAKQDSFTQFACDELDGSLWTAAKHTFVLPEDKRLPDIKPVARWEWTRACETLEIRLGENTFVTGETFTVPDLLIGHCAGWALAAKFDWPDGSVGNYFQRLLDRPARARALKAG